MKMKGVRSLFLGSFGGKAVGLTREIAFASVLGTGVYASSYRLAQTATLIPLNFFTADALAAGFLPRYKTLLIENHEASYRYYQVFRNLLVLFGLTLSVMLYLFSGPVITALAPGGTDSLIAESTKMLKVVSIGITPYLYVNIVSYRLMAAGHYTFASSRATVQSLGLIVTLPIAVMTNEFYLLAAGFTGAYVLLAAIGHQDSKKVLDHKHYRRKIGAGNYWAELKQTVSTIYPLIPIPLFLQGMIAAERMTASLISDGALASAEYARFITDTVIALVAAPLGMALLTNISGMNRDAALDIAKKKIYLALTFVTPISAILACCSTEIVRLAFQRGQFDATSTHETALVLLGMAIGLWAHLGNQLSMKSLQATGQNKLVALAIGSGALATIFLLAKTHEHLGAASIGISAAFGSLLSFVIFSMNLQMIGTVILQVARLATFTVVGLAVSKLCRIEVASLPQYAQDAACLGSASIAIVAITALEFGIRAHVRNKQGTQ